MYSLKNNDDKTQNVLLVDLCYPNPCKNGRKCNATKGQVTCACKDPCTGKNCSQSNPNYSTLSQMQFGESIPICENIISSLKHNLIYLQAFSMFRMSKLKSSLSDVKAFFVFYCLQ